MTRRRWMLLSLGCLVGMAAYLASPRDSAINAENAARIEVGMDLGTVEALLGGPARDESTGPLEDEPTGVDAVDSLDWIEVLTAPEEIQFEWISDTTVIRIVFVDDKAQIPRVIAVRRVRETPWTMLRRWLKL